MTRATVLLLLVLAGVAQAPAPAPPATAAPTLTELQRLKVQNLTQRLELAQLRAQAAQREFDLAREQLTALIGGELKVDGYTFDIASLTYTKEPPKEGK